MGQDERHGARRSRRLDRRHSRRQPTQGNPEKQHGHDPGMTIQSHRNGVSVIQINLQHCKAATAVLCKQIARMDSVIVLIQEPWINGSKILGLGTLCQSAYRGSSGDGARSCIVAKGLNVYNLPRFGTRDLTAVRVEYCQNDVNTCAILASVYMPIDADIPTHEVEQLITYCDLPLIIGYDTNSHHVEWGNTCNNSRGHLLVEFVASTNLEIINVGGEPTFVSGNRQSVIDITLATPPIAYDIDDWSVSGEDSMSDHRYITFILKRHRKPLGFSRNPQRTNWSMYDQELNQSIGMWIGKVTTLGDIERELTNLNKAVIGSFENACLQRRISRRKKVPWWNP